jgi:cytochrome c oxidase subunit II
MTKLISFTFIGFLCLMAFSGCKHGASGPTEHVKVVMKKYTFDPPIIKVKSGDTVELEVSTADVQHGFSVPQLGIREAIQPGKPATITFQAPAKGEYGVECSIICGPHHDDMQAKLVVE